MIMKTNPVFNQQAENDFQGRRLAVAGYTSREKQALRVFSSAPILKRYDVVTLETSDGICVILNGFMNKARTMENRFPSEVCDHFVFGFPPYWKDYDEKFISNDSSSGNILGVDPVKKLSPQSKGGKLHEDSHDHSGGSQDGMNSKDVLKSGKTKSFAAPFPETSDYIISGDKSNMSSMSSGVHEQQPNNAAPAFQDPISLNMLLDIPEGTMNSLTYSNIGVTAHIPSVNDKEVVDCQINGCGRILIAHHLSGSSRGKMARKVGLGKKNVKANVVRNATLSDDINDQTEGSVKTCAIHGSTRKRKSNKRTESKSGDEMSRLTSPSPVSDEKAESASAACVSRGTDIWNSEVSGLRKRTVKRNVTKLGACSVEDECERTFGTPREKHKSTSLPDADAAIEHRFETPVQNEDQKVTKIRGKQKEKHKATSLLGAGAAAAEQMSEAKEYETPDPGKVEVCDTSNKFLGFSRSRSGRLLVPPLKFWCNQRAIYDLDRTVTGIQECLPVEEPRKGSRSKPSR